LIEEPRIALVRARYSPFGGAERFVDHALTALRDNGVAVTLLTRSWKEGHALPAITCNPFYVGNVWRDWGFARSVCQTLARENFDLVQSHERIACCDLYRAGDGVHREWLAQRSRTLSAFGRTRIALNPYHAYVKYAEAALFHSPRLRAIICNSRMVKDEICAWFQVPDQKIHVIYSGVDTERFHPRLRHEHYTAFRSAHDVPQDATLFLCVGSGFERKGISRLIQAFSALTGNAYLAIVGKDKSLARYEKLAYRRGAAARIRFLGALKDVAPCYGAADAFVLPTLYDPFPNVVLEAMASGLPVITSTKSGGAELIEPDRNGYVCDALDVEALAGHMGSLLPRDRAAEMGRRAREIVLPYTFDAMSARLRCLYDVLLRERATV
jgi:UDP-glucose:(heptosyl)LPS alpha-1,3-glucosyltransferase